MQFNYLSMLGLKLNHASERGPRWHMLQWIGSSLVTHWGQVTHICVSKLTTTIGSDNGVSPGRRQAVIWTNDGILLIGHLGTNFSEILIGIHISMVSCQKGPTRHAYAWQIGPFWQDTFDVFIKKCIKTLSAKWRPFCPGLNVSSGWLVASSPIPVPVLANCKLGPLSIYLFRSGPPFTNMVYL